MRSSSILTGMFLIIVMLWVPSCSTAGRSEGLSGDQLKNKKVFVVVDSRNEYVRSELENEFQSQLGKRGSQGVPSHTEMTFDELQSPGSINNPSPRSHLI